ncbi:MAG: hypothetical protein EDS66_05100 [Planctomycetota bacterium]|nr:MAG: hypothetical protein EDS66_05100 [Planctomycetota bacterium]
MDRRPRADRGFLGRGDSCGGAAARRRGGAAARRRGGQPGRAGGRQRQPEGSRAERLRLGGGCGGFHQADHGRGVQYIRPGDLQRRRITGRLMRSPGFRRRRTARRVWRRVWRCRTTAALRGFREARVTTNSWSAWRMQPSRLGTADRSYRIYVAVE